MYKYIYSYMPIDKLKVISSLCKRYPWGSSYIFQKMLASIGSLKTCYVTYELSEMALRIVWVIFCLSFSMITVMSGWKESWHGSTIEICLVAMLLWSIMLFSFTPILLSLWCCELAFEVHWEAFFGNLY